MGVWVRCFATRERARCKRAGTRSAAPRAAARQSRHTWAMLGSGFGAPRARAISRRAGRLSDGVGGRPLAAAQAQHGGLGHAGRGLEGHARQAGRALQGGAARALHLRQRRVQQRRLRRARPARLCTAAGACRKLSTHHSLMAAAVQQRRLRRARPTRLCTGPGVPRVINAVQPHSRSGPGVRRSEVRRRDAWRAFLAALAAACAHASGCTARSQTSQGRPAASVPARLFGCMASGTCHAPPWV